MDHNKIEQGVRLMLEGMGEDPTREGLVDTPARVARADDAVFCVGEQYRLTVRGFYGDENAGNRGHKAVRAVVSFLSPVGRDDVR
jgi:GTP cyclohydrolase I